MKLRSQQEKRKRGAEKQHYARLLEWARLMARVRDLEEAIDEAKRNGTLDPCDGHSALECLQLIREDFVAGLPQS